MAVPETAMYKDACLVLSEHNIWLPDQRPYVESKPEALGVQQFSNFQFGPGILPPIWDIMRERISLLTVSIFIFSRLIGAKLRVRAS